MSQTNGSAPLLSLRTQLKLFVLFLLIISLQTIQLGSRLFRVEPSGGGAGPPKPVRGLQPSSSGPRDVGLVLPDGTVTFTPGEFKAGRIDRYVNLPNVPVDPARDEEVQRLTAEDVPPPAEELLHRAPAPPGNNAILGLASYPTFMDGWRKLVGSLRINGYDGHIIMGVNPAIPEEERDYLDRMGVTYYAVAPAECDPRILEGTADAGTNAVRGKCSRGLEGLKLEWGRYEMARRWLAACDKCTRWSMVIDTRDIFFQSDPFKSLGDPNNAQHDLLFVEEVAKYTNTLPDAPHRATNLGESRRYAAHVRPCYKREAMRAYALADRPMLCSGTVIGTRQGMHRFLSVLVDEFGRNNARGPACRSPATTDQWTMNHLYYQGKFGDRDGTRTLPWGTGPVLTVGKPCVNSALKGDAGSQRDMMEFEDGTGRVLNPHEGEGSETRVAPALHQWDRCRKWMRPWFKEHRDLFTSTELPEDEPAMEWVGGG